MIYCFSWCYRNSFLEQCSVSGVTRCSGNQICTNTNVSPGFTCSCPANLVLSTDNTNCVCKFHQWYLWEMSFTKEFVAPIPLRNPYSLYVPWTYINQLRECSIYLNFYITWYWYNNILPILKNILFQTVPCVRNPCPANTVCANSGLTRTCSCASGYTAVTVGGIINLSSDCRDINECTETSSTGAPLHNCVAGQTCTNTIGSFSCVSCKYFSYDSFLLLFFFDWTSLTFKIFH